MCVYAVTMSSSESHTRVAIWCASAALEAHALAAETGLPIVDADRADQFDLLLTVTDTGLELREPVHMHRPGFTVDFSDLSSQHLSKDQPIARAFGKDTSTILDATAGWGRDAYLLACLGFQVTLVERSPIVTAMLREGVKRSARGALDRMTVMQGDARAVLRSLEHPPDAVYIDPMYPPKKKKSALPRKPIALLRQLVGNDDDAGDLFEVAMATAQRRVVVKRADDTPSIAPNPTSTHGGKTARYDVYLAPQR